MKAACECGNLLCKGPLVCDHCGVPDEYARFPKDMFTTLMSAHNRIRMTCGVCIYELTQGRAGCPPGEVIIHG